MTMKSKYKVGDKLRLKDNSQLKLEVASELGEHKYLCPFTKQVTICFGYRVIDNYGYEFVISHDCDGYELLEK